MEFLLAGVYMQLYLSPGALLSCDFFLLSRNAKIDMLKVGRALFSMKRVNYAIAVQTMAI